MSGLIDVNIEEKQNDEKFTRKRMNSHLKNFRNMKELCIHIWEHPEMICQMCPFHVLKPDRTECYFEYIGGKAPKDWNEDDLGRLV